MPHIVIEGPVKLDAVFNSYTPSARSIDGGALKLTDMFINKEHSCLLIQAIAAEGGPPNRFFVQVLQREGKSTVKLYPGSDPEKTPGVKRLIALAAHQILTQTPGSTYGPTNLAEYLL